MYICIYVKTMKDSPRRERARARTHAHMHRIQRLKTNKPTNLKKQTISHSCNTLTQRLSLSLSLASLSLSHTQNTWASLAIGGKKSFTLLRHTHAQTTRASFAIDLERSTSNS